VRTFTDSQHDAAREAILLAGIEILPDAAYRCISEIQRVAARRGYPELS